MNAPLLLCPSISLCNKVWLFANCEKREAVIAFRGTEQIKWKDLVTDINLTPIALNPERLDSDAGEGRGSGHG